VLTIVSLLAESAIVDATDRAASPALLAVHPRPRARIVHSAVPSHRRQPFMASATTEELLCRRDDLSANHPDRAKLRARAIEMNLPLARRLARRYAGRGELLDDLSQAAAVALINAVDRYDPGRQTPFAGFAVPSILGALKRHFRDTTWAMRVPRPIQELARRLPMAAERLGHQLGRTPTTADLAADLHATVDDVLAAIGARQNYHLPSLNKPNDDSGFDLISGIGDIDPRYAGVDDHLSVQPLLARLPVRERRILALRFYDHMTQAQIAAEIGTSQMQVSRLLRQSLARLRAAAPGPTALIPNAGSGG
jgi:RNA polymerase sigma-B factor